MRIAQGAPLFAPLPPAHYGGSETVVYALTGELVRCRREVTLFAPGGAETSAVLHKCSPRSLGDLAPADPLPDRVHQVKELVPRSNVLVPRGWSTTMSPSLEV